MHTHTHTQTHTQLGYEADRGRQKNRKECMLSKYAHTHAGHAERDSATAAEEKACGT